MDRSHKFKIALAVVAAGMWNWTAQGQYYVAKDNDPGSLQFGTVYKEVQILKPGHMVNGINEIADRATGKTPLMLDVEERNIEAILFLLARGVDTTARDDFGRTALDLARRTNVQRIVEILELDQAIHPSAEEYYAGRDAQIHIMSGDGQEGSLAGALAKPLIVLVTDKNGKGLMNAPVNFRSGENEETLLTSHESPSDKTLILRTDHFGFCGVYFAMPETEGPRTVTASVGQEGHPKKVTFHEWAAEDAIYQDPFSIHDCTGNMNGPGVSYSWSAGSREVASVTALIAYPNGEEKVLKRIPSNETSVTFGR